MNFCHEDSRLSVFVYLYYFRNTSMDEVTSLLKTQFHNDNMMIFLIFLSATFIATVDICNIVLKLETNPSR